MNEEGITKIEAARRLVHAAIAMLFRNDDPLAVHTVAMAAHGVLRDLAKRRNLEHDIDSLVGRGGEREFWRAFKHGANFLKHADWDADDILTPMPDGANEAILVIACDYYRRLGNQYTIEMGVLLAWHTSLHPDRLSKDADPKIAAFVNLTRNEQLEFGRILLNQALAQA